MRALEELVSLLTRLPGIGRKSALRMAYFMLRSDASYANALSERIASLRQAIGFCSVCGSYTETDPCPVCSGYDRDRRLVCVVEQPQDVLTIEASMEFKGLYHVLGGLLSPLDGIGPDRLRIASLVQRIRKAGPAAAGQPEVKIEEVVLATNPTVEGDTTALYIKKVLEREGVKVTRLATGIPVGGDLEYADRLTLARSFHGRTSL
jgi:recombination protein RecR